MNIRAAKYVQNLRGLSLAEKAVAHAMAVHAAYETSECFMSMERLASEAGLKKRETASRIVKQLEAKGIVVPAGGNHSKGGRGCTTRWTFTYGAQCDLKSQFSPSRDAEKRDSESQLLAETVTGESRIAPETVTLEPETVTGESHKGFKVFSLPPARRAETSDPVSGEPSEGGDVAVARAADQTHLPTMQGGPDGTDFSRPQIDISIDTDVLPRSGRKRKTAGHAGKKTMTGWRAEFQLRVQQVAAQREVVFSVPLPDKVFEWVEETAKHCKFGIEEAQSVVIDWLEARKFDGLKNPNVVWEMMGREILGFLPVNHR